MICPQCNNPEMKYIKEGISKKTGRPYSAFYKCEQCNKTISAGAAKTNFPKPEYNPIEQAMYRKERGIEASQERKEASIMTANAKHGAGEIVAAMIHAGELKSSDWLIKYKEIANKIYNFTPQEEKKVDGYDPIEVDDVNF